MNTEQISAFVSAVEYGTFTRAAEELFISESALSHRIQSLESELGYPLFARKRGVRRIELTDEGQQLLPIAQQILRLMGQARGITSKGAGELRIAATHSMQSHFLPDVISLFSAREGVPQLFIMASNSTTACDLVARGEAEFAFVNTVSTSAVLIKELVAREDIVFVSWADSVYGDVVSTGELSPRDEIYLAWTDLINMWHGLWFGSAPPMIRLESSTTLSAMLEGQPRRWALLPISVAKSFEHRGFAKVSALDHPAPPRDIWLVSGMTSSVEYHDYLLEDLRKVVSGMEGMMAIG